jgi:hypothetical protein
MFFVGTTIGMGMGNFLRGIHWNIVDKHYEITLEISICEDLSMRTMGTLMKTNMFIHLISKFNFYSNTLTNLHSFYHLS